MNSFEQYEIWKQNLLKLCLDFVHSDLNISNNMWVNKEINFIIFYKDKNVQKLIIGYFNNQFCIP